MTIEASNLTNSEYYKLNGTLSAERIESLLDIETINVKDVVSRASCYISEAIQPFSAEDFLSDVIKDVNRLIKDLRGNNRVELQRILENLDDVAQCTFNAVENSDDLLDKARHALDGLDL